MAPPHATSWRAVRHLLAHDLTLGWRDFRSSFRLLDDRVLTLLVVVLLLVMHAAAWSTGGQLAADDDGHPAQRIDVIRLLSPAVAFVMLLMLAQSLNGLTKSLYGRGDLDLLLSSPFPARVVLLVRVLATALGAGASAAIFVLPVANAGLLHGAWRSLALVPALAGGALLAAAVGLTIVMALFGLLGPRRTRLAVQIIATFVGGGFMVWLQFSRLMPRWHLFGGGAGGAALDPDTPWLLPVRAAAGDPGSLALWLLLSSGLYGLAALGFAGRFARSVAAASSVPATPKRRLQSSRDTRFVTRLGAALRVKEWRLIRRDPWLLSQLMLQILYMTPMLAMVWNGTGPGSTLEVALSPMIVVVCYQVAASMTWLSLSAEDAPELLATAPVTMRALQWGKLVAVAQLTAMLAIVPLLWLATLSLRSAGLTALLAILAVVMAMQLSLWHTRPAKRSVFAARHRESKLLALMEMVMSMLLGVTGALLCVGSLWGLAPLGIACLILAVNRPRGRARGPALAAPSPDLDKAAPPQPGQQTA